MPVVAIVCTVVALGTSTAFQKHFGSTVEQEALQACEKAIDASFPVTTTDAPTMRREGRYEILTWHRHKLDAPNEPELVEKPIICKFDVERRRVIHVSVH